MTKRQAEQLREGNRVMWNSDPNDLGTVVDTGYAGVTVRWDNGQTGMTDLRDMQDVALA